MLLFIISAVLVMLFTAAEWAGPPKPSQSLASSYLIEKWSLLFSFLDANRDGVLNMNDMEHFFDKLYKDLDYQNDERLKTIAQNFKQQWQKVHLNGNTAISKENFMKMMKEKYESDTNAFIEMIREFSLVLAAMKDLNGDGFISNEELMMEVIALGHNDRSKDEKFVSAFHTSSQMYHVKYFSEEFVRFVTESFETKPDMFKKAFECEQ